MTKKGTFCALLFLLIFLVSPPYTVKADSLKNDEIILEFPAPLRGAAQEIYEIYPAIKADLEETLGWRLDFRPTVLITKDRRAFQGRAVSHLIVAYAVPGRNLIVIDYSKINAHPFAVEVTLKHELSHLLLHHYIPGENLPKWLDEGISQSVSGGVAEILLGERGGALKQAVLSKNFISIRQMTVSFPDDEKGLLLAYEESKSIVEYIQRQFGPEAIRKVLRLLKTGEGGDAAILKGLSIPLDELERRWHRDLRENITWLVYISNNIYLLLFFLAGLVTIVGFIRLLRRKRAYVDDEDEMTDL